MMEAMQRLHKDDAIVLQTKRFGEIHKRIDLLTAGHGLVHANAFGASKGKSRLSGVVLPFSEISVNLYLDPVKGMYKITDAVPLSVNDAIHQDLEKYFAASLIAELLMKTYAGGDASHFYRLSSDVYREMNGCGRRGTVNLVIYYLWKYIDLAGFGPDLHRCSACGKEMDEEKSVFFSPADTAYRCAACSRGEGVPLSRGGISYITHSQSLPLNRAVNVFADSDSQRKILTIIRHSLESIMEAPLKSMPVWEEQL
jgi:DNA repair protein RecO (recombination protein O)